MAQLKFRYAELELLMENNDEFNCSILLADNCPVLNAD